MLHSIRAKFLIRVTALFVTVFVGISFAMVNGLPFSSFDGWKGHARVEMLTSLNLVADLEKEHIIKWFRERQGDAQVLADNSQLQTDLARLLANLRDSSANDEDYKTLLQSSRNRAFYDQIHSLISNTKTAYAVYGAVNYRRIQVIDIKTGTVLVSTNDAEIGFPIDAHDKFLEQTIRSGHYYLSDVNPEIDGTEPHINIAHTVTDPNGVPIGVVALEITLNNALDQLLQPGHQLGASGESLLVNGESRILTPLRHALADGTQAGVMQYIITAKPARLAAAGKEGSIESQDYRGVAVIAAYRYLNLSPEWGWGLVVKIDKSQLFATINKGIRYSLWLGAVGISLVIILNIVLTGRVTGPLRQMTRVAVRMAGGELSARAMINSNDEIGQLSSVFDSMAADIEHWHQDLERRISERTNSLNEEIQERKRIEQKVQQLNTSLEKRVTERTAELTAVNKELESFTYSVAHDLRAPLRAIDGFSQALVEDYGECLEGEAKEFLGYLREGSQEMGALIDDLLKLSRATRGAISRQNIDLSQLATECMQALQQTDPDRKAEVDIAAGIIVNADQRLMRVMLENLLENAWKFTARETTAQIQFGAEPVGMKMRCWVRDNGVGFDMTYKNKLFTPFTRLHSREDFEGTGIGLSTVQHIINRHGGTITAQSHVGEGACFIFELDAAANDGHHEGLQADG